MKSLARLASFSILLISFCLIIVDFATASNQHSDINEVIAIGHGESLLEARNDVIRQALQQTMQQLIVVDRVIQDDQIIRDKIMSTMNGYIDQFQEIRSFEENGQIAVEAKITVSSSRITNFIGSNAGKAATMSGNSILAESQRMVSQRKALGEIFDHFFIGFPSDVIELTITGINIDEQSSDTLNVAVKINYSKLWLEQLYTGLKTLSIDHASSGDCPNRCDETWYINTAQSNLAKSRWHKVQRKEKDPTDVGHTEFCMEYGGRGECFMLPTGDYTKTLILGDILPPVFLAIRFVDANGSPTFIDKARCQFADKLYPEINPNHRIRAGIASKKGDVMYRDWQYMDHTRLTLSPLNINAMFKYKGSAIDLARTTKLGAVATFGGMRFDDKSLRIDTGSYGSENKRWFPIANIAGNINSQPNVCDSKIDDAIRWMPNP